MHATEARTYGMKIRKKRASTPTKKAQEEDRACNLFIYLFLVYFW
jgi:hypothetical protein